MKLKVTSYCTFFVPPGQGHKFHVIQKSGLLKQEEKTKKQDRSNYISLEIKLEDM